MSLSAAKLKALEKNDNLSEWQKAQKSGSSTFFIKQKTFDPWEIRRTEENVIHKQIPSLETIKAKSCVSNHRFNKDINQHLENQRILKARKEFYKSTK